VGNNGVPRAPLQSVGKPVLHACDQCGAGVATWTDHLEQRVSNHVFFFDRQHQSLGQARDVTVERAPLSQADRDKIQGQSQVT
jgi:hypothetical protein